MEFVLVCVFAVSMFSVEFCHVFVMSHARVRVRVRVILYEVMYTEVKTPHTVF